MKQHRFLGWGCRDMHGHGDDHRLQTQVKYITQRKKPHDETLSDADALRGRRPV